VPPYKYKEGSMELSRRDFLKASGIGASSVFIFQALDPEAALAIGEPNRLPLRKRRGEKTTICPYDASGCGFIVETEGGKVVNIEGDPEHPINNGAGCAKGQSIRQLDAQNPRRLSKVLYRAPGATQWQEQTWDWAINEIAQRIKSTRDTSFIERDTGGNLVNRTEAIANLGGSSLDNEECYLLVKMMRALGLVYIEHHARI
jgi:formate dehydrogenase major subunit